MTTDETQDGEGFARALAEACRDGRRWWLGHNSGDTFAEDDDYDGLAITIEIRSVAEARTIVAALTS